MAESMRSLADILGKIEPFIATLNDEHRACFDALITRAKLTEQMHGIMERLRMALMSAFEEAHTAFADAPPAPAPAPRTRPLQANQPKSKKLYGQQAAAYRSRILNALLEHGYTNTVALKQYAGQGVSRATYHYQVGLLIKDGLVGSTGEREAKTYYLTRKGKRRS